VLQMLGVSRGLSMLRLMELFLLLPEQQAD
jgi:hypothetical protein